MKLTTDQSLFEQRGFTKEILTDYDKCDYDFPFKKFIIYSINLKDNAILSVTFSYQSTNEKDWVLWACFSEVMINNSPAVLCADEWLQLNAIYRVFTGASLW